jgi:hypothetical protein
VSFVSYYSPMPSKQLGSVQFGVPTSSQTWGWNSIIRQAPLPAKAPAAPSGGMGVQTGQQLGGGGGGGMALASTGNEGGGGSSSSSPMPYVYLAAVLVVAWLVFRH